MTIATFTEIGNDARPAAAAATGECGPIFISWDGEIELVALAQNQIATVTKIPAWSQIIGLSWFHDAMGSNTSLQWGLHAADGTVIDAAAFKATAATTGAGSGYIVPALPILVEVDSVLTITNTGAGAATGTVIGKVHYIYRGH
jgi:hypothetical protein